MKNFIPKPVAEARRYVQNAKDLLEEKADSASKTATMATKAKQPVTTAYASPTTLSTAVPSCLPRQHKKTCRTG